MNATNPICDVAEKQNLTISGAIASSIVLSLIGILGTCGNILVLVVYCVRPRRRFNNPYIVITPPNAVAVRTHPIPGILRQQSSSSTDLTRRQQQNFTQTRLILVLAVVDLLTCVLVLPWDVVKPVKFILTTNRTWFEHYNQWFQTRELINFSLEVPLTLLRNLAFAGEGSILAAIAVERFLAVVPSSKSPCRRKRTVKSLHNSNVEKQPPKQLNRCDTEEQGPEEQNDMDEAQQPPSHSYQTNNTPTPFGSPNRCSRCFTRTNCVNKRRTQQLCIWGIIITVCSAVFILELIIVLLQNYSSQCVLAKWIRELADKVYVLFTLISCMFICYLYFSVFLIVHQTDLRKHRWKKQTLQRRSSLKLSKTPIPLKSKRREETEVDEVLVLGEPENPITVEAERSKYVNFAPNEPAPRANTVADEAGISHVLRDSQTQQTAPPSPVSSSKSKSSFLRSRRTGLMLFTSTVVFYATLFPVLWVHFRLWSEDSKVHNQGIDSQRRHSRSVVHHEFYYVNNAVNVFIYSLLNDRFRERVKLLFRPAAPHLEQTLGHIENNV